MLSGKFFQSCIPLVKAWSMSFRWMAGTMFNGFFHDIMDDNSPKYSLKYTTHVTHRHQVLSNLRLPRWVILVLQHKWNFSVDISPHVTIVLRSSTCKHSRLLETSDYGWLRSTMVIPLHHVIPIKLSLSEPSDPRALQFFGKSFGSPTRRCSEWPATCAE